MPDAPDRARTAPEPARDAARHARRAHPRRASCARSSRLSRRSCRRTAAQFERDKETLRGSASRSRSRSIGDVGEIGYRVHPDDYYLPELDLDAEERAALHVAVTAVSLGATQRGEGALMKLGGLERRRPPTPHRRARRSRRRSRRCSRRSARRAVVTFTYRGEPAHARAVGARRRSAGHWYVVGHDRDRDAIRAFRVDRIDGDVAVGEPDAFTPPPTTSAPTTTSRTARGCYGDDEPVDRPSARRRRPRAGGARRARRRRDGRRRATDGTVVVELTVMNRAAFRSFVLGFLDHAEVLAPPELRADIVAWLEQLAARATGMSPRPLAGAEVAARARARAVDRRAPGHDQGRARAAVRASRSTQLDATSSCC